MTSHVSRFALIACIVLTCAGIALAGGKPSGGAKTGTKISGSGPQTFPFSVSQDQQHVEWHDGKKYWWNANTERYERGSGWIDFNTDGGGWQHQPPGGGNPAAGSYSPAP